MYRIGIDLGGTNIAVGVVDDNYNIIGEGKVKTNAPRPAEEICDDIAKAVMMAVKNAGLTLDDIGFVGIGAPGSINPITGIIGFYNNDAAQNANLRRRKTDTARLAHRFLHIVKKCYYAGSYLVNASGDLAESGIVLF